MTFVRWTEIEGFHNVRKAVNKYDLHSGVITYRGKIKLHGTNAGITIKPNGDVVPQSRSAIIGTGNDNCGFAQWVEDTSDVWKQIRLIDQVTIFGEWCGPGVQKGVAINKVNEKQFVIFAIQRSETDDDGNAPMIISPFAIKEFLSDRYINLPRNVHVLPWYDEIEVDFADDVSLEKVVERMNEKVAAVEAVDYWVKKVFDIEGTGEGIVYYPVSFAARDDKETINRTYLSTFMFKVKGEKHKVQKDRAAVILDPEVVESINAFADKFITEQRLEQGATEINRGVLDFDNKLIGAFIGWVSKDVKKESGDELEASGLDWKPVSKEVTARARKWYLDKISTI